MSNFQKKFQEKIDSLTKEESKEVNELLEFVFKNKLNITTLVDSYKPIVQEALTREKDKKNNIIKIKDLNRDFKTTAATMRAGLTKMRIYLPNHRKNYTGIGYMNKVITGKISYFKTDNINWVSVPLYDEL